MSRPTTRDDKKVAAALAIRSVATNLKGFDRALGDAIAIFSTNPPSQSCTETQRSQATKALQDLKQCIGSSCDQLLQQVRILDPIPSLDYVHSRQKQQQQLVQNTTNISGRSSSAGSGPAPPPKRTKSPTVQAPKPFLSAPENDTECSKQKVVENISATPMTIAPPPKRTKNPIVQAPKPALPSNKNDTEYLQQKVVENLSETPKNIAPPPRRTKNPTSEDPKPALPLPKNGTEYSKVEVVQIISAVRKNSARRTELVTEMMANKLVPVTRRQIYRLLEKYEAKRMSLRELDRPWNGVGRPRLLWNGGDEVSDEQTSAKISRRKRTFGISGPAAPRKRAKNITIQGPKPVLPSPKNGTEYTRVETVEILCATPKNSAQRNDLLTEMMAKVPVTKRTMYRLLEKYEEKGLTLKDLDRPWNNAGRTPILCHEDIEAIAIDIHSKSGHRLDEETVKAAIVERCAMQRQARGIQSTASSPTAPSTTTIRNYKSLIAAQPKVTIARVSPTKNQTLLPQALRGRIIVSNICKPVDNNVGNEMPNLSYRVHFYISLPAR